ncbi:transposase family protein [Streptomyces sp. NPDC058000]|uniref:helix-turn-helix domain-containing protein n=1 Tax=Streptomyces sp. NPDC058000 TaxID=3346299 RepID=UPI0036E5710F
MASCLDPNERREGDRRREAGAGPKYELVFTDRLLATLVHLRTGLTHEALGVLYEVGSSTIGRAIQEVRPLPADRGFAVPDRPGILLRTLDDAFVHAAAEGVAETHRAIAALVSARAAERPTRHKPSTEPVHVRSKSC